MEFIAFTDESSITASRYRSQCVVSVEESRSDEQVLIQVADLFAGMFVFSCKSYGFAGYSRALLRTTRYPQELAIR